MAVTNSMIEEGMDYLNQHQILELFEDLCTLLVYEKPAEMKGYLINELKNRKTQGPAGHVVFTDQELRNVFTLFDLKQEGHLNKDQCREALRTIAHSVHQNEKVDNMFIPEQVDVMNFRQLALQALR